MNRLLAITIVLLASSLGGCASLGVNPGSTTGECKVFQDPGFAVRGKTLRDNQWIGRTQETGIKVCGWKRPFAGQ